MWYFVIAGIMFAAGLILIFTFWADGDEEAATIGARISLGAIVWPLTIFLWLLWLAFGQPPLAFRRKR